MKLTQIVDHLTASLALVAAHRTSRQITYNYKILAGWTCEVVSGMFSLGGGGRWTGGNRLQFRIVVGHYAWYQLLMFFTNFSFIL